MYPLIIDGSRGEGGGQILRTSLTLSAITGRPIVLENIRAGREKPGLMRQHMMAIRAATETCAAEVTGIALGSQKVTFRPQTPPKHANYTFAIGSAGSTMLVLQTILPILLSKPASEPITITLEGGTHNPMAPPWSFFVNAFVPVLRRFGVHLDAKLIRPGFYPAGGGKVEVTLRPSSTGLVACDLFRAAGEVQLNSVVEIAKIPSAVGKREHTQAISLLGQVHGKTLDRRHLETITYEDALCAGNIYGVRAKHRYEDADFAEYFVTFGERGLSAETVARDSCEQFLRWDAAGVFAGEHLADQLLLPMALGGGGRFSTLAPSLHTTTQAETLALFGVAEVGFQERGDDHFDVEVRRLGARPPGTAAGGEETARRTL
jgi:RNA 3'-terminal phosphate cyclase (ATP)